MVVVTLMMLGRSLTALAASMALVMPSTSVLPSGTCCTCQP